MIAVQARGRLGNAMFQYAFGLSTAVRLNTTFAMDVSQLKPVFSLEGHGRSSPAIRRWLTLIAGGQFSRLPHTEVTNDEDPRDRLPSLADRMRYGGFFQSEDYLQGAHELVRSALTLLPAHREEFIRRYGSLVEEGYVCIHVRRGDYLDWMGGVALPWSYAREALDHVGEGIQVVFISDEIAEVRSAFADISRARFEQNDPAIDLQLLMHARYAVLSNSSFAWWGGWLASPHRQATLAPKGWLGFKHGREWPVRVIPEAWQQLDVARPEERP